MSDDFSRIHIRIIALEGDVPATAQALERHLMTLVGRANVTLSLVPTGSLASTVLPNQSAADESAVCLVLMGTHWSQLAANTPALIPWMTIEATQEKSLLLFARTGNSHGLPPELARCSAFADKSVFVIDEGIGFSHSVKTMMQAMATHAGATRRNQLTRWFRRIFGGVGVVAVVALAMWQGPALVEKGIARLHARDPAYPMELVQQGYDQMKNNQIDGAIALFDQAVAIAPNTFQAHEALALAYAKKGDDAQALLAWDQVILAAPWYTDAYLARGWLHFKLKQDEAALADFAVVKSTSKAEQTAQSYTGSGWIYFRQTDYTRAAADFQQATELMPMSKDAYMGLGWSLFSLKHFEASALALEQWVRLDPTAEAFLMLGKAQDEAGQFKAALVSLRRYAELEPKPDSDIVKRIEVLTRSTMIVPALSIWG